MTETAMSVFPHIPTKHQGSVPQRSAQELESHILIDALGRVLSITQSDGEARNIGYSGRAKESTDEMGISRIRQSDGLGRLTTVCEDNIEHHAWGLGITNELRDRHFRHRQAYDL